MRINPANAGRIASAPAASFNAVCSRVGDAAYEKSRSQKTAPIQARQPRMMNVHHSTTFEVKYSASIAPTPSATASARHGRSRMPERRVHSHIAMPQNAPITATKAGVGTNRNSAIANGVISSAVMTRCFIFAIVPDCEDHKAAILGRTFQFATSPSYLFLPQLRARFTISPLARGEISDRGIEVGRVEVRPEHVGKDQFGVGELPEQEVAHAFLAAGADEQVQRRQLGQREVSGQ